MWPVFAGCVARYFRFIPLDLYWGCFGIGADSHMWPNSSHHIHAKAEAARERLICKNVLCSLTLL